MAVEKSKGGWNPYLAGALAGLLAVGSAYATTQVTGKTASLGVSTTFVRAAGKIEKQIWPQHVDANAYFKKEKICFDWQAALVCGVLVGALLSTLTGRSFEWEAVPERFVRRFNRRPGLRAVLGFLGGAIALFGTRLAGGCPTGHGLSGGMQLSISGLTALLCFFIGGALTAKKLYKRGPYE